MYKQCIRCVMDMATEITFDENGYCNFCEDYLFKSNSQFLADPNKIKELKKLLINQIISQGKNKIYNCIVGISGGVDSAWVLYQAKKYQLKPFSCTHG